MWCIPQANYFITPLALFVHNEKQKSFNGVWGLLSNTIQMKTQTSNRHQIYLNSCLLWIMVP